MRVYHVLFFIFLLAQTNLFGQASEDVYLEPINDPSAEGQRFFVEELLDIAGYVPRKSKSIKLYQIKHVSLELN